MHIYLFYQELNNTFITNINYKRLFKPLIMKLIMKCLMYSNIVVRIITASTLIFKNHPEVQLAFLIPGVFIFVYSKIRDEMYVSAAARLRMARGR